MQEHPCFSCPYVDYFYEWTADGPCKWPNCKDFKEFEEAEDSSDKDNKK